MLSWIKSVFIHQMLAIYGLLTHQCQTKGTVHILVPALLIWSDLLPVV